MTKKQWLKAITFLLLVVLVLYSLSWLLRDRHTTLSALYSEPDNTVDVLIVGSSHVNSGYIPNLLWEENRLSACNVYSWSQPMWISYHYIKEALKTQQPTTVVLELFGMTYGHSYIMPQEIDKTSYANSFDIDSGINFLQMAATVEKCGLDLRQFEDFLYLPRYHTRWKTAFSDLIAYNPHKDHDPLKGYGPTYTVTAFEQPAFSIPQQSLAPYEYASAYLDKIVALCRAKDIQLIFSLVPYVSTPEEAGIYRWLTDYAATQDIPFFNYNGADGARIGIDFSTDLADNGHLNFSGAYKVTQDLCAYLNLRYPAQAENKNSHANAQQLESDYAAYRRIIEANTLMTETDPAKWLKTALADENYALFIADDGNAPIAEDDIYALLRKTGVTADGGFCAVIDGGKLYTQNAQSSFSLFGKAGTLRFDLDTSSAIFINETEAPLTASGLHIVLYDKILMRPLETVILNPQTPHLLQHREFTSDILPLFH